MHRIFKAIDEGIRFVAMAGIAVFGTIAGLFAILGMGAPSSTIRLWHILGAGAVMFLVAYLAYSPQSIAKLLPLSKTASDVIARIIVYPVGITLGILSIRQAWQVGIPEMLGMVGL